MKKNLLIIIAMIISLAGFTQIPSGYYNGTSGLTGEALKSTLNDIIDGHTELSYSECWDALKVTDRDPNNSSNIIGIYSRFSINGAGEYAGGDGWNREHVWPQSRGDFGTSRGAGTDVHHLRASDVSTNSARSNKAFDNGGTAYTDASGTHSGPTPVFRDSDSWEPGDAQKGDIARMIFYMATRYEGENGEPDLELTEEILGSSDKQPLHGRLSTLLVWHADDPVDQEEINRHEAIFDIQGNRNPFIDHPEWVDEIWGDGGSDSPDIDVSETGVIDLGEVSAGQNSASESYTVFGSNLEGNISVSVSSPFQLSLNNSSWSNAVTVPQANAEGGGQTVFVRFSPTSNSGQTYNQSISHSSTNASSVFVSVTGDEQVDPNDPSISLSTNSLDFGEVAFGNFSDESFSVSAENLTSNLVITPPSQVSLSLSSAFDGGVFTSSSPLELTPSEGTVESTTIFSRYTPAADDQSTLSGNITFVSTDVSSIVSVTGSELEEVATPTGWINEFHYENDGQDQNEFVEIYFENVTSEDLSQFTIELVQVDGNVYSSFLASSMTSNTDGYYFRNFGGIQNGPNGIRLRYGSDVVDFIAYEGEIDGAELLSVQEDENSNDQTSIGLCCNESSPDAMSWVAGMPATPGLPNEGITLGVEANNFQIYPNPTKEVIQLKGDKQLQSATLIDASGKTLLEVEGNTQEIERALNQKLPSLDAGTYVLNVFSQSANEVLRLVLQK